MTASFGKIYKPGDVIGGIYEVHRQLGEGGFGLIYLVYSRETKKVYALKTFRDECLADAAARDAFKRESLLWVNLEDYPFILAARLVVEFSGRLFVAMDFVAPDERGRVSIEDHIVRSRGPLDTKQILEWSIQFCYGMEYANTHGIRVHRDIKPANILITQDGTLKITDFGLAAGATAALREGKSIFSVSADGRPGCSLLQAEGKGWCGTPGYIAPEVYEGKSADVRSDIYSFGVVLWQIAKGSPFSPFHSTEVQYKGDRQAYLMEYQQKVYENQRAGRVPAVDGLLQGIMGRCLTFEPSGRYHDFKQLRLELEPVFEQLAGRRVLVPEVGEKTFAFWNNKGGSLDSLGRYNEAIHCFDKALEIDPRHTVAWNNKGVSLKSLGRYEEAIHCYDKALEIDLRFSGVWNNKGDSLYYLGRYEEAIRCHDKALEIDQRNEYAWSNKGNSLHSLGQYQEAIDCFDKALEIDPRHSGSWNNKGVSLNSLGRYEEAIYCYDRALEIAPRLAGAWYNKGIALHILDRYDEAVNCFDKAIEIDNRNARAWINKGANLDSLGRYNEAISCWDKAIEINPGFIVAWYNKGFSLESLGRYQEAIDCCNKAIEIDPRYISAWFSKALWEERVGRKQEAAKSYRQFIELSTPEYAKQIDYARQRLAELEK